MPGARYALNIVQARSPVLRIRYRDGVLVDPYGFPDWLLYARAVVQAPLPEPGLTLDEMRVLDVLAANAAMAERGDDPLWAGATGTLGTPHGWCWAHLGRTRGLALVPVELHGSYRHAGGVRTMGVTGTGLRTDPRPAGIAFHPGEPVPDDVLDELERLVGAPLPAPYRSYLGRTNGAGPAGPAVLAGHGFVADQPLFGIARTDPHQDLAYARDWFTDRFTPDLLPIGYVQGGVLLLGLRDPVAGSVWFWDDDDPRDDAAYGPVEIRDRLLRRCADSFDEFRDRLTRPPTALVERAWAWNTTGRIQVVRHELAGAGLPPAMRAPAQPRPTKSHDPIVSMFELT
jgi:hypothetical protein